MGGGGARPPLASLFGTAENGSGERGSCSAPALLLCTGTSAAPLRSPFPPLRVLLRVRVFRDESRGARSTLHPLTASPSRPFCPSSQPATSSSPCSWCLAASTPRSLLPEPYTQISPCQGPGARPQAVPGARSLTPPTQLALFTQQQHPGSNPPLLHPEEDEGWAAAPEGSGRWRGPRGAEPEPGGGSASVPRVSPGCPQVATPPGKVSCCLWADLHASSPPPAQLRSPRAGDGDMGEPRGRRRPLQPRLLALLLIAAGSAGAQPQPVSGVRGHSVLLSLALPNSSWVKTAEWHFRAGTGKKIQVAEFGPNGFERPDPHDRFKQRLEMPNATALRIGGLEPGDSGIYGVWIKYNSTVEVEDQAFNLSVYEPVPPPQIHPQLLSRSPQGCNVTLRCSLPPTSPARTSWQLGNTSGTLWEQSGDGQTLWLAIPPSALDATYTCVARSPAEERSSSVSLSALCQLEGGRQRWAICMGVLAAVGGLLSVLCCLRRRRRKAEEGAPGVAEEPQYAQVPRRGPAKEDEAPPQPSDPLRTIYSEVGASTHSLAQPQA
uniref:Ig-like domain-containing protein n=1 Tax=Cairina moschata TaxID=8855 RepID=A0A8C3BWA1_CAIMO